MPVPPTTPDERLLLVLKPSPLLIIRRSISALLLLGIVAAVFVYGFRSRQNYDAASKAVWIAETLLVLKIIWEVLLWFSTTYMLTTRRMVSARGVIRRLIVEVPLENIQHTLTYKSIFERLVGLGTLGAATAGSGGGLEIVWLFLRDPAKIAEEIRLACDQARAKRHVAATPASPPEKPDPPLHLAH
jgi:uncharacterized membrane protein YdbT with pleckstrin-like domain